MNAKLLAVLAVIVMIAAGGYILLTSSSTDTTARSLQYDDYVESIQYGEISSCSGSVELIKIGDVEYLHASDVGFGTITYSNQTTETIDVVKAQLDVYLLIGQSNAEYRVYGSLSESTSPIIGTSYYYGTSDRPLIYSDADGTEYGIYDMVKTDGSTIGNIESPLASKLYELSGHKTLVINGAIGGVNVASYAPNANSWTYAKDTWDTAISLIDPDHYDINIMSYIWIQGENDNHTSTTDYRTSYMIMHDSLIGNSENVFSDNSLQSGFIVKVRSVVSANASSAQIDLCTNNSDIIMATEMADGFSVYSGDINQGDYIHYTQKADNQLGNAIAMSIWGNNNEI